MSNILGENKFILYLRSIPLFTRIFISFLFLGFISVLYFFFFYSCINQEIKNHKFLSKDLKKQERVLVKISDQIKDIEGKNKLFFSNYKNFLNKNYFSNFDIGSFFKISEKHNLICLDFKPFKKSKTDNYKKYYYELNFKGDFNNFVYFLEDFINVKNFKFKQINIKNSDENKLIFFTKIRFIKFLKKHDVKI